MKNILFSLVLFLILIIGISLSNYTGNIVGDPSEHLLVERVIDGDTVALANGERVRLIGIDTPERGQPYYDEAKLFLEQLAEGKIARLETDTTERDKYGRLLRYLYIKDMFVNLEMLKEGYAAALFYEPDIRYQEMFLQAEAQARDEGKGIWSLQGEDFCFGIFSFHYNAKGNDNENLNDEYITFRNKCTGPLSLAGWSLSDSQNTRFTFSSLTVLPKAYLTVHTGSGENNGTDLFWGKSRALWDNDGDTVLVWDSTGKLRLNYSY